MKISILATIAFLNIVIATPISACTIYFTNDTQNHVLITLADNSLAIPIGANKTKMFGDGTKHAVFTVWQKAKGADRYRQVAFLKQHGCNKGKRIDVNMSDVQRGVVNKALFTMTLHDKK